MIISVVSGEAAWQCLARRGMLHSECESVDHLRLPPGAAVSHAPDDAVDQAVFVVSGSAELGSEIVRAGQVLLLPQRTAEVVRAGTDGLEAVTIRVLSGEVISRLPARVPELPEMERSA